MKRLKKLSKLKLKPGNLLNREELLDFRGGSGGGGGCPSIQRGYHGYSQSTGCWYYGTLYTDNNCETLFVPDSGTNGILNPPICGDGIWV